MISCTEFIPAYSELFKYIEELGGYEAVQEYWLHLGETGLENLVADVKELGLAGCFKYWSGTLNEEAADFTMTLDEENNLFKIEMHYCPSKGKLLSLDYFKPYDKYCYHCGALYPRALAPLGYEYVDDYTNIDKASCVCTVRKICPQAQK